MSQGNGRSNILTFTRPPSRVVSLVPSVTDSLFEFGLGGHLVGVTDFCQPSEGDMARLKRVGGTRSPEIDAILDLKPDLVIANMEENSRESVEALEAAGLKVWVTFPRTVQGALDLLWTFTSLFRANEPAAKIKALEVSLDWAARAAEDGQRLRVFCPIWMEATADAEPWFMTFNRDTYAHDLLASCGGENVFADRDRRYPLAADLGRAEAEDPGDRDVRYPRVTLAEIRQAEPEVILLPDEPFGFDETHEGKITGWLSETPAVRNGRVHRIDGSLITWHGTRLGRALAELPRYFGAEG